MANTSAIFSANPDVQTGGAILGVTAVNSTQVLTDSAIVQIFVAGANGSWIDRVVLKPINSPAATVVRIYYCSATGAYTPGTTNTAVNMGVLTEFTMAAITSSAVAAQNDISIPIRSAIPANTKLLIGFGTSTGAAGTGYTSLTFAGDY